MYYTKHVLTLGDVRTVILDPSYVAVVSGRYKFRLPS